MNVDAVSVILSGRKLRQRALKVLCLAGLLLIPLQARAGEKFKITETPEKVDLPKDFEKDLLTAPPDFLHSRINGGESGQGPMMPTPGQPTLMRNPRLDEWLDRKKNWIFDSPNSVDQEKTVHEIFGVRDESFVTEVKKTPSVMQQYMESDKDSQKSKLNNRTSDGMPGRDGVGKRKDRDRSDQMEGTEDRQNRENLGIMPALNPAPLFNWGVGPEGLSQVGEGLNRSSILPAGLGEGIFGQKLPASQAQDPNQGQNQFDRIRDTRRLPLDRLTDPINAQPDATRFAIDPISARRNTTLPVDTSPGAASGPVGFASSPVASTRPDFVGLGRTLPTAPSFAPSAIPVRAPLPQPKPAVLEIPRPRF